MLRARAVGSVAVAIFVATMLAVPTGALALTSVEGAIIGDQGYYWATPAESWIFPHRIGNIDNRVMLQWGASTPVNLYNLESIQRQVGGGFILELMDDMNLGLWVSEYTPGMAGFVQRGINETFFDAGISGASNPDLENGNVDPYAGGVEAGRKLDLFASYWLPAAAIEAGVRLWYGSGHHNEQDDDSTGPIDIDPDSDPATPSAPAAAAGADLQDPVAESKFGMSELGLGFGAGWAGIEGMRLDVGVQFSKMGVSWEPNGVTDFVDAGGTGLGLDARAYYDMSDKITVGGFLRYHRQGLHFEPKMQRDGGDLQDFWVRDEPTVGTPSQGNIDPPDVDPATCVDCTPPFAGLKYEESNNDMQLAGLARFRPNSRATLYSAVGLYRQSSVQKASIGSDWSWEEKTTTGSLPFIHMGFEGAVFRHMNVFLGASKRWQGEGQDYAGFDGRIPDDGNVGATGTPPVDGDPNGDNTNANRREYTTKTHDDTTDTNLFLGTRIRYGGLELVGALDPGVLNRGVYFLNGVSGGTTWFWVSLVYDWDYDTDKQSGNGSGKSVPNGFPTGKETFES